MANDRFYAENEVAKKENRFLSTMKRLFKNKGSVVGLIIIVLLVLVAILAPYLTPYGYADLDIPNRFAKPSAEHPFGCDELGRDILSRVMYGGRYSLRIGFSATIIGCVMGVLLGSVAGYFGGWVDNVVMRLVDVVQAIPGTLLSISICSVLGTGINQMSVALGVGVIAAYCRLLRGSILTVRKNEYIDAAVADNSSSFRIIMKHVLPNAISPIIVQATLGTANAILLASSLSFIGMGIKPPNPEWGAMLSSGRAYIRDYPYLLIFPGLAIAITVLSLNLLGDGLRDALDPKLKR